MYTSPLTQIRASAGAGKTYTLTQHFLRLLQGAVSGVPLTGCATASPAHSGYALSELLAATFTNRAAAEMKLRIISSLKELALVEKPQPYQKSTSQNQSRLPQNADAQSQGDNSGRFNQIAYNQDIAEEGWDGSPYNHNPLFECNADSPETPPIRPFVASWWVNTLLRHYSSVNIRTIDSLLTTLVRLSALELGLSPDFEPSFLEEEYFTPYYDALMEDLSIAVRQESAPSDGSSPFLTNTAAALRSALEDACRAQLYFSKSSGFTLKGKLHGNIHDLVVRALSGETVPIPDSGKLRTALHLCHEKLKVASVRLLEHIQNEKLKASQHLLNALEKVKVSSPLKPPPISVMLSKENLDACLNKASQGEASPQAEKSYANLAEAYATFQHHYPVIKSALQLAPLTVLTHEILARMDVPENTMVAGPRIPILASKVLSGDYGVSDALCRLGTRLTHLMLDEFQDTSRVQWAAILPLVVECLSRGGSLVYVGDMKQAIYGWRGGDAALFADALYEPSLLCLMEQKPLALPLNDNWRSTPNIVQHNNAFFSLLNNVHIAQKTLAAMLPKETPPHYLATAVANVTQVFDQAAQTLPQSRRHPADKQGKVRLYTVEGADTTAVQGLLHDRLYHLFVQELCPHRPYSDMAVLVRSGAEGSLLAEWLTTWGLPVVTENSFRLASHPLITRLVAFLTFLDYPPDDAAFWTFILGPECFGKASGLSADALTQWAAIVTQKHVKRPPLYLLFRQDFPQIWESLIAPFYSQAGLMSAYDTLQEVIARFSLMRDAADIPFLRRLLEVAQLAETQGYSSPSAFLAFWKEHGDEEKLPLPESMNAIRIMTVHKAKGLEFPVVILPFHHHMRNKQDVELAEVQIEGETVLTRISAELEDIYYPACITEELERLNLLYVAWTRPAEELHVFITRPKNILTQSPLARGLAVLLEELKASATSPCTWEYIGAPQDEEELVESDMPKVEQPSFEITPLCCFNENAHIENREALEESSLPPTPWRPMQWLPRLKIYRSSLEKPQLTARRRGILVHLCLESLVLSRAPSGLSAQALQDLRSQEVHMAVKRAMRLFPLPLEHPEEAAHSMQTCLLWFACQPMAEHWLAKGLREQSILDGQGNLHRVDLLVDAGTHWVVIDYKTGQPDPAYDEQIQRYMGLLAAAQERPVQGVLVYLDMQESKELAQDN